MISKTCLIIDFSIFFSNPSDYILGLLEKMIKRIAIAEFIFSLNKLVSCSRLVLSIWSPFFCLLRVANRFSKAFFENFPLFLSIG